jgi:ligand-binding sensor domain-containing protein
MKRPLFFVFFILLYVAVPAQWVNFNTENANGLTQGRVNGFTETSDGLLWAATDHGLWYYDQGVEIWCVRQIPGLSSSAAINAVFTDASGSLWIGTYDHGVFIKDLAGSWLSLDTADGLSGMDVRAIIQDQLGRMWFASFDGGIDRLENNIFSHYGLSENIPEDSYVSALCDSYGRLWFGTLGHGVVLNSYAGWQRFAQGSGLSGNDVNGLMEDANHSVFLCGNYGICKYYGGYWDYFLVPGNVAYNAHTINDTTVWIGTSVGTLVYNYPEMSLLTVADGLAENTIRALYGDNSGKIWAGHETLGVSVYYDSAWHTQTPASGILSDCFRDVAKDDTGALWFATAFGLSVYANGSWHTLTEADGTPYHDWREIEVDALGRIWALTEAYLGKLCMFDGISWTTYDAGNGLINATPLTLHADDMNRIWVGYANAEKITRILNGTSLHYDLTDSLNVVDIDVSNTDAIWMATDHGVIKLENFLITQYGIIDGLPNLNATSITVNGDNDIWAGFSDAYTGGVAHFNGTQWTSSTQPYFPSRYISDLLIKSTTGSIWTVAAYNSTEELVVEYANDIDMFVYDRDDGIRGQLFSRLFEDDQHSIWALTADAGANVYYDPVGVDETAANNDLSRIFPNPTTGTFTIQFELGSSETLDLSIIDIYGKIVYTEQEISFAPGPNEFTVDLSALQDGNYFYFVTGTGLQLRGVVVVLR